tara:strand:- start:104 stop:226 length:123 start_codon:yes stop_codon:yes gene_type:complete
MKINIIETIKLANPANITIDDLNGPVLKNDTRGESRISKI